MTIDDNDGVDDDDDDTYITVMTIMEWNGNKNKKTN